MATAEERQARIAQVRDFPSKLERAVSGLSDRQLDATSGGEDWSVRSIVHHMADSHINLFVRIKLILTEEKPILKPFDQDSWAKMADSRGFPVQPSLEIVRGVHQRLAALLENLPEEAWGRTGIHLQRGILTLDDMVQTCANHGEDHLRQIERAKAG